MAETDSNGTNREKVVRNVMTRGTKDASNDREKAVQSVMTRPQGAMQAMGKHSPSNVKANAVSRYHVKIDGIEHAVFSEVSGLQLETELFEYQEGGNNGFVYKLPSITKAGNVTLKRGVAADNALLKWYMKIVSGMMDLREISIAMYATQAFEGKEGQAAQRAPVPPIITWTFSAAYPCKWSGPQLAAGTDTVAIETVEFAHMGEIKVT